MKTKLHGLDHLRALAIVMVFIFHYGRLFGHPTWMEAISSFGWTGVDLFFVLSGFLISSQLFQTIVKGDKVSLSQFYIKRFVRIIPTYLLMVGIYFLFPLLREYGTPAPLWKYLTFTQNIGLDLSTQGTFSHAWSLCIEEQFYLLFPLVVLLLLRFKALRKGVVVLPLLFLFGLFIRWYCYQNLVLPFAAADNFFVIWYKWIYYPVWCRLDGLLIGVGLATLSQFKPLLMAKIQNHGYLWLGFSFAVLCASWLLCSNPESFSASVFGFPLVDAGYGFMVLAAISPQCFLYRWKSKVTVMLATLSYAVYLSHKVVIHLMQMQLKHWRFGLDSSLTFLICLVASLSIASAMNWLIEKPILKFRNRLFNL